MSLFLKNLILKIIPSKFAFVKSFLGTVSIYEIHLNVETLEFTVIMIYSLFFVTNASIFISDIFNIFINISLTTYRTFRYRFIYDYKIKLAVSVNFFSLDTF